MTTFAGQAYPVGRSARVCAATGRALAPGEAVMAVLVARNDDGRLERLDFSLDAWHPGAVTQGAVIGQWRAVIRAGERKAYVLDDDAMLELIEQTDGPMTPDALSQSDQPGPGPGDGSAGDGERVGETNAARGERQASRRRALRMVLALLLVRRRVLALERTEGTTMLLRRRGLPLPPEGPELLRVEDPGMDEALLADVAAELEPLTGGLGASADAGASPTGSAHGAERPA